MNATTVILLGLGLAVDSTLVALALGLRAGPRRGRAALGVGLTFGVVHGALTLLGWAVGENIADWFAAFDHWVAFGVLAALGVKTLLEARKSLEVPPALSLATVGIASVATSLDGVAVGFGLAVAAEPVVWVAACAALATAVGSTTTFLLGRSLPDGARRAAQVGAGLLLISIGASILYEHLGP